MDEQSAQVFGCFVGILVTIGFTQILFSFVTLPLWLEYIVIGICAAVFIFLGIIIARKSGKKFSTPPQKQPPSP